MKKVYRSTNNKMIGGVFGGLGEYFDIDPTLLRLVGLLLFFFTGFIPFLFFYLITILIIPSKRDKDEKNDK